MFKAKDQEKYFFKDSQGLPSVKIIIRDCPIQQAVLTYNLEQGDPSIHFCILIW
ncbi:MAG: hypothetical protein ACFFBD_01395 [Candidatus Hodarchaeota archaeon]